VKKVIFRLAGSPFLTGGGLELIAARPPGGSGTGNGANEDIFHSLLTPRRPTLLNHEETMSRKVLSESEFVLLITRHQASMYAYILTIHPNRVAAQDILQESNIVLCRKRSEFEPGTSFKAWALRIAYWQTMAHLKRVKRSGFVELEPDVIDLVSQEAEEHLGDFEDRHTALRSCLQKLPPGDTSILLAHYRNGESIADLSGRLGRSRDALKQVLMRIRRALRACIERQLAQEGSA
jgi:RNA polymerase sigma-70 factor (ECF subfamily)